MLRWYVAASLWWERLRSRQRGQSLAEYALIIALVAIAVIAVMTTMGDTLKAVFQRIIDKLNGILNANP